MHCLMLACCLSPLTTGLYEKERLMSGRTLHERGSNFFLQDARDAHTLMEHLSFPKYSVMGWCDGGVAGMFLSSAFPQAVRNLVAWGCKSFITDEDVELFEQTRDVTTWNVEVSEPASRRCGQTGWTAFWS